VQVFELDLPCFGLSLPTFRPTRFCRRGMSPYCSLCTLSLSFDAIILGLCLVSTLLITR
jgi:hypothetical protein